MDYQQIKNNLCHSGDHDTQAFVEKGGSQILLKSNTFSYVMSI